MMIDLIGQGGSVPSDSPAIRLGALACSRDGAELAPVRDCT
jgi:hypothetical protein